MHSGRQRRVNLEVGATQGATGVAENALLEFLSSRVPELLS